MPGTAHLILIAAREADMLAVWEELLGQVGYAAIACQTARATWQNIEANHPDLLLLARDLDWPEAGWDLLHAVRGQATLTTLPVILYTTDRHWLCVQQRQLQDWQCQIWPHPFRAAELWTIIATALTSADLPSSEVEQPLHCLPHETWQSPLTAWETDCAL